jgi:signal transduction histidine kinase
MSKRETMASGSDVDLLAGPGEARALMRTRDWDSTPLGPPVRWPSTLRAVVGVMLTSRFAMWMAWGSELTFLCNDAYLPTVGVKRDWVIGSRSDKVWAEIWPDIGPRIAHVLSTGEATWDESLLLYLERRGFSEETYHTFSYSPLADDAGRNAGMLCVVAEVTEKVIGERQLGTLRDLGSRLAAASTRAEVMASVELCLTDEPRDLPFAIAYLVGSAGKEATLAAAHGLERSGPGAPPVIALDGRDHLWPLDVAATGPALVSVPQEAVANLRLDRWQHAPTQALIAPIVSAQGGLPLGFLVAGLNPHRAANADYRGFVELLAGQVSAAIVRADDFERAKARVEALAEIDRAKTAFFSNVSHEFRTPLTLMLGPLEDALAEAEALPEDQRQRLDVAHRNALRLLRLVNSLLDFSRIESGRVQASFRPVDLAALTADLAASFRSATDKAGLRLIVDTPPLSEPVYVDRDMWEKVVLNLLSNAFKFTFHGEIVVELRDADGQARLTVRDTGTGIPQAELPKLFDRFHRVESARGRSFEGSGIGLALVQELVKLHGGQISVASELERGSAFTVSIPLGSSHLSAERVEADLADAPRGVRVQSYVDEALRWLPGEAGEALLDSGASQLAPLDSFGLAASSPASGACVLLADDNADLRSYIARLLTERGYEVTSAADGEAALDQIRRRRPDLVVTDVMMPRLDGFALLRAIREDPALRDLPVVVLSARAGEEAKVEGLEAGADDYLAKPFSARELLARVAANIALARLRREAAEAVRASEEVAREQAERVQLALDAGAIIGTWVWDIQNDRLIADERFARSFNLSPEECRAGLPLAKVMESIHEEDKPNVARSIADALRGGGAYRCEYRVHQQDGGYRWVEANGRVDLGPDGAPIRFPGILIDVDHRRAIETALRELNEDLERRVQSAIAERERVEEELRQAQKMEALGQLTGGIAHDFNNLLTIVIGNVDMARRALTNSEVSRAGRAIDSAQKGAERAATLTQRLLAFSRRQPLAPKPIDLDRLVAGMGDLLHRALGEIVELETVSTAGLWKAEADPNQLEATILNLAVNARDAMPEGGKLTIETANVRLDEQYAGAHAEVAPGSYVALAVTDTGHGMSREVLSKALDPFFTTKGIGRGTGLGLSMAYGFVKQSGGHLKIYSEEGQGTTVKIYLPRLLHVDEAVDESESAPVDRIKGNHSILVVEDDDDVRAYTVEILRELGYRVIEAHDGPSALRLIERQDRQIDLMFTDVVMPGMSGRELADRARAVQPELKIIYTSGYTRNAIVHGGRLDAGVEVIAKPFTYQALAQKVADVLEAGRIGRILLVAQNASARTSAGHALVELGYSVDQAATGSEALGRARAAQGRYDAVVLDDELPDKTAEALAVEMRANFADLPILVASGERVGPLAARFAKDRGIAIISKVYDSSELQAALTELGVGWGARPP